MASVHEVRSPLSAVVAEIAAPAGSEVAAGAVVVVLESMKMHHEVDAPAAGVVGDLSVEPGDQVGAGAVLFAIEEREAPAVEATEPVSGSEMRADLDRVLERRRMTGDEARPDAVARRHEAGRRTARENVADLCDEGSFVEYGGLAVAAQRARRELDELIERTPGDGMVCGTATVNVERFGADRSRAVVLSYDYTVLAGTQGLRNHRKTDRMLDLARRERLPVVLFAEGGGGRPGDTDRSELFHLDVPTFHSFAALSGLVPRIGVVSGRCFAGNAALLGCCDLIVATPDATIGMGGPAMIEGGGLGSFAPEEVGPAEVQEANGVIDVLAGDEAEAVALTRHLLSCFQGSVAEWGAADQAGLRTMVPEDRRRAHDVRAVLAVLADEGSVVELRPRWGRTILTALARIEGRAVGVIGNDPASLGGAIDADGADKAARFVQLCDAFGLPVISLMDTPGFMVGPDSEREGAVRHCSRLFLAAATASVPWIAVTLRRGYGLGAQAMAGGSFHAPVLNVAWPTGEFGAMGVEGAVRLALRRELEEIEDAEARERRVRELAETVRGESGALNMATHFEIDDVIDPADTRELIAATLRSAPPAGAGGRRTMVDAW